jgi:hypothetical protein
MDKRLLVIGAHSASVSQVLRRGLDFARGLGGTEDLAANLHVWQGECGYGPLRCVWFGFVVTTMTVRVLKGEQLLRQRMLGDGCSGFEHFGARTSETLSMRQRCLAKQTHQ